MNIVITGSSHGIGQTLAAHLLREGHAVWGLARSLQPELRARPPGSFHATRCDVASWPQVSAAADEVARAWDRVDALVTCAAVHGEIAPALSSDPAKWSAAVRSNLDGTYHAIRAFAALLRRGRRAKVVCFSGGGASKARPRFSAYAASKTAVVRLVETIAQEEGDKNFDINVVAPGSIPTRLLDEIVALGPDVVGPAEFAAADKQRAQESPVGKVIEWVDWLLSAESDGVSGRFVSAQWDSRPDLPGRLRDPANADLFTLRRVTPDSRSK